MPYDKGEESDSKEGWLPNYYVPTNYFIDWSKESVKELYDRRSWSKKKSAMRNSQYWFKKGITFSLTGQYCPTFRVSSKSMFDNNGSKLFLDEHNVEILLGYLCSKLNRFLFNIFIDHTVHAQVDEMKNIILPNFSFMNRDQEKLRNLVTQIINKQKSNLRYDYMTDEQVEIDRLVYQMYNLNDEDIAEVENWYFRRYPKPAQAIEKKFNTGRKEIVSFDIEN